MTLTTLLTIAIILAPVLITLGYIRTCHSRPFKHCGRCQGTGRVRSTFGLSMRECPPCQGTGRRLRTGRHVLNYARRIRQAHNAARLHDDRRR
ncbi:hypothetical protein [Fodinicola acaciae]|uniref:hypothetical protein n=1 Tax=Fodinicola acaciae TaxID=2681555 RepID=UPI0013D0EB42|nr:hypothetical protein [Fodinicola acaciae]